MLLASKGQTYLSIELYKGKVLYQVGFIKLNKFFRITKPVVFQYNLGHGTKKFVSSATYNDGNWHRISASRDGAKGRLQIDNKEERDITNDVEGSNLELIETVSFGGRKFKTI